VESSLSIVDARSSNEVKTIAERLRTTKLCDDDLVHRLCAIVQLDKEVGATQALAAIEKDQAPTVACWGSDLRPPGGRHDNDHSNFRDISLVPTQDELSYRGRSWLPLASGENAFISDPEQRLLDKNFRLLREDAVGAMRENILAPRPSKVWKNARIIGASCQHAFNPKGTAPLYFLMQLDPHKSIDWKKQRSLPNDGLIVLSNERTSHVMASIFVRKCDDPGEWLQHPGGPIIGVKFHHAAEVQKAIRDVAENKSINEIFQKNVEKLAKATDGKEKIGALPNDLKANFKTYDVTEVSDSFFAYKPVLESLRSMASVPLSDELVHLRDNGPRPDYLPRNVRLPASFNRVECDLENWSHTSMVEQTTLNESQSRALQLALTSKVALIQGPPGTGKTFVGSLIAQVIRQNTDESILVICYTNHALDQFLEYMLRLGEEKLVRIGGRTRSENLKKYELKSLSRKEKTFNVTDADCRMRSVVAQLHACKEEMTKLLKTLQMPLTWNEPNGGVNELFSTIGGNLHLNFEVRNSDGFVTLAKKNKTVDEEYLFNAWKEGKDCPSWLQDSIFWIDDPDFQNLWVLRHEERLDQLHRWKDFHLETLMATLENVNRRYDELSAEKANISQEIDSLVLSEARIIGATTTGAAKYKELISIKSASVVMCEEAGEVTEQNVISALTERMENSKETKHLILIGDHLQLRPKVESYSLTKVSGNGFDLDVSLFERLIQSGFKSAMLNVQHRMRPCIADLIRRQTYPTLEDDPRVSKYPAVKGVASNMLFLDHSVYEDGAGNYEITTKSNSYEASLCVEIVRYLLLQGYRHSQVTILTPYVGQILTISREMKRRMKDVSAYVSDLDQETLLRQEDVNDPDMSTVVQAGDENSIRCASIDNFQGEESDIVVTSLVRSNAQGSIGFLKEEQRVNVLLSRAKHGMYLLGNSKTLRLSQKGKHVWNPLIEIFENTGNIVESFPTVCQLHPNDGISYCTTLQDFRIQRPNGGCCRPCNARLSCGHACPLMCHPTDRSHIVTHKQCTQPCRRIPLKCPHNHPCKRRCNEECGPCLHVLDEEVILPCGHTVTSPTCDSVCDATSRKKLAKKCREEVTFAFLPCNHRCTTTCANMNSEHPVCPSICGETLACGHKCQLRCSSCKTMGHSCEQKCERTLFCGHVCGRPCHGDEKCPPCNNKCEVACEHSMCSGKCRNVCSSCVEECDWQCEHEGSCSLVCGAPCNRFPCNKRCNKFLRCGHQCPSVCGEHCPSEEFCIQCCSDSVRDEIVDMIEFKSYGEHDIDSDPIIFLKCGHFYPISTLDGHMELLKAYEVDTNGNFKDLKPLASGLDASKPKACPNCRSIVSSVKRYGRLISFYRLRSLEMKHMIRFNIEIQKYSQVFEDTDDAGKLEKVVDKIVRLENDLKMGPMMKVYEACAGQDVDVKPPPVDSLIKLKMLYAMYAGKLVRESRDNWYGKASKAYDEAIRLADASDSRKSGSQLRINYSKLMLTWLANSDAKPKVISLLEWVITEGVDDELKKEARAMKESCERDNIIREVVKAMNVVHGYDYGGGWSSHWYECPNGHPYFIGECGGAMEVGRCMECGAEVGGSSHQLLGTNRPAGGAVADAML